MPNNSSYKNLLDHVLNLHIPQSQNGRPSLLLHNLREDETYDLSASGIMTKIFNEFRHLYITNPSKNVSTFNALLLFQYTNQHFWIWQNSAAPLKIVLFMGILFGDASGCK